MKGGAFGRASLPPPPHGRRWWGASARAGTAPAAPSPRRNRFPQWPFGAPDHGDTRSGSRERASDGAADTAPPAGNKSMLAVKGHRSSLSQFFAATIPRRRLYFTLKIFKLHACCKDILS